MIFVQNSPNFCSSKCANETCELHQQNGSAFTPISVSLAGDLNVAERNTLITRSTTNQTTPSNMVYLSKWRICEIHKEWAGNLTKGVGKLNLAFEMVALKHK